jgi:murein DD-endopeptidase MepM/ murein hydrolase activator NlpD
MLRTRLRAAETAKERLAQVMAFTALLAGTAALASPAAREAGLIGARGAVSAAVQDLRFQDAWPVEPQQLVWQGDDVDGDGEADFANPPGGAPRDHDAYGSGAYGARRDGGSRRHEGVDFTAEAGQSVAAPISGYVTKIGYAYAGDQDLRFVEITNPALGYAARVFYVEPSVEVGEAVAVGRPIGEVRSLQDKYPGGMTDHVHLEVMQKGRRIDANQVLTARWESPARGKQG